MIDWINTHGLELLFGGWLYSLIVGAMPPLPPGSGWWVTFLHNALQVTAANASRIVKESPIMQRFISKDQSPDGASHEEMFAASVPAKSPA